MRWFEGCARTVLEAIHFSVHPRSGSNGNVVVSSFGGPHKNTDVWAGPVWRMPYLNEKLFNGIYEGWILLDNNLGNIRSMLFDMGCVEEEKVSENGTMFANIKIGNDELDQFIGIKGFELCADKDILLTN